MTTTIETHSAADVSVGWLKPSDTIGDDTLAPGRYALAVTGDSVAVFVGTTEDLARFISHLDAALGQLMTHEAQAKEPEPELPSVIKALAAAGQPFWTTAQLRQEFTVQEFIAGMVIVTRKSDGVQGTLSFTHMPRYYFDWQATS